MDDKNKARMAVILLATAFRRFGLAINPQTTRIADWQGDERILGVTENEGEVKVYTEAQVVEYGLGQAGVVVLHQDHVTFTTGKRVPVIFGFDNAHNILVVSQLDNTLEEMYKVFVNMGKKNG